MFGGDLVSRIPSTCSYICSFFEEGRGDAVEAFESIGLEFDEVTGQISGDR